MTREAIPRIRARIIAGAAGVAVARRTCARFIAGTGANSTREAVELTEAAKSGGADACLLVTPYYNKPTQEGLYQHFRHIA